MFQGSSALALDVKGRMNVPQRHREALVERCQGELTLTKHPHGCLMIFPRPVWEQHRAQIAAWPMSARPWQRIFLGFATDVALDTAGRILISPELREAANLQRDVMLLGMGSHFELWDAGLLKLEEQKTLAADVPVSLGDFSF
ncbi:MAG: division/cell wall cluster transcriptional repressor MraZ [Burkholderiaceae bacterium]